MARKADHASGHSSSSSRNANGVLRQFVTRYRYLAPALTVGVAVPVLLAGVGENFGWTIVIALGVGALTAAITCLAWDMWLHS
jgi:hypothetical protein